MPRDRAGEYAQKSAPHLQNQWLMRNAFR